jgi:hypothetical protein
LRVAAGHAPERHSLDAVALLTDRDVMEATRAAGAMVGRPDSFIAAALVHFVVSAFWALVLRRSPSGRNLPTT